MRLFFWVGFSLFRFTKSLIELSLSLQRLQKKLSGRGCYLVPPLPFGESLENIWAGGSELLTSTAYLIHDESLFGFGLQWPLNDKFTLKLVRNYLPATVELQFSSVAGNFMLDVYSKSSNLLFVVLFSRHHCMISLFLAFLDKKRFRFWQKSSNLQRPQLCGPNLMLIQYPWGFSLFAFWVLFSLSVFRKPPEIFIITK